MPGAAEAIFSLARVAGLVAHAIEEYPYRLRFRPRAAYTGPRPSPRGPAAVDAQHVPVTLPDASHAR